MKTARIILTCLLALLVMCSCNKEEAPDGNPVVTVLGQRTCIGEIGFVPIPWTNPEYPPIPGLLLGLSCDDQKYILSLSHEGSRICDNYLLFDGTRYEVGDRVEITGTVSYVYIPATGRDYWELDIRSIRYTDQAEYPVTTVLGERTCSGEIVEVPNPPSTTSEPTLPGMALGFTCADDTYVLIHMGNWMFADQPLLVDGISYAVGDRVEITGTASFVQVSPTQEYLQLEIRSIRRIDYPEPVVTVLGERTCTGEIIEVPNPPHDPEEPVLPGVVLALQTVDGAYILTRNGGWIFDQRLTVAGTVYMVGDRVEITGTATSVQITASEYMELEVEAIVALPAH